MEVHKTKQKRKRSRSPSASKKLKKEKKKKHRSHSSDSSEISVSIKKKSSHKKKKKKDKKKKEKKHKRKATFLDDEGRSKVKEEKDTSKEVAAPKSSSVETHKKRTMVPMTKEEYERQQSVVRRVFDPQTGRNRLVKGDGEILEEIVSKARHKEINEMSTKQDGRSFEASIGILR